MGVKNKAYSPDPALLSTLLQQDRLQGRFERIGKELGIPPGLVPKIAKRLNISIPDRVTPPEAERRKSVKSRKIARSGHSFYAEQRLRDPRWALWRQAKARALSLGREFDLEISDIILPEVCPVLGIPLVINFGGKGFKPNSPSLDRIDSGRGYVWNNVVVVSCRANILKKDATLQEMQKIANFYSNLTPSQVRRPIEKHVEKKGRPIALTPEVRLKIVAMCQQGKNKSEVAQECGISVSSVNRALKEAGKLWA